jgi:uncharacterized glyoxalase superfamily protein PhnB
MRKTNRAAPNTAVIPVLYYPEVRDAVEWLTTALPFTERLRIGDHRCQLAYDGGAIVVAEPGGHADAAPSTLQSPAAHSVMLRVTDVDARFYCARAAGARVLTEPADHMYGERQCSFLDPWGHPWTLSETIFDSDPAEWGGELLAPNPRLAQQPLDALAVASNHHRLLFENNAARVLDTKIGPGERTRIHAHEWAAALYVRSWSDFVRYDPDGNVLFDSRTMEATPAIGFALWSGPIGPHYVDNVGQTDLHLIAVEVKE